MIVVGDRVYARRAEERPQESEQASPKPSAKSQDHSPSAVSVEHEKRQRYG